MITDAGKWLEISTSRHLSSLMTGWVSAPSNDSANNCRFYWQQAIFLPATFKAGDDQSLSKVAVMTGKGSTQRLCASSRYEGCTESGSQIVRLQTPQRVDKEKICNYSRKTQLTKVADSNLSNKSGRLKSFCWFCDAFQFMEGQNTDLDYGKLLRKYAMNIHS